MMTKFDLLDDFGVTTVSENYRPASLRKQNAGYFVYDDRARSDRHFRPTRIPRPGDKLWFRVFGQVMPGKTTYAERVAFCRKQARNVFIGSAGLSLVFEEWRESLCKGRWYASLDEPERLLKYEVPNLVVLERGGFGFHLASFDRELDEDDVFLCVCDLSVVSA
ncbi:MAG: hypothetical protein Q7R69_01935 [bacterium]|nr:hypothetical protein [bacterium]